MKSAQTLITFKYSFKSAQTNCAEMIDKVGYIVYPAATLAAGHALIKFNTLSGDSQ